MDVQITISHSDHSENKNAEGQEKYACIYLVRHGKTKLNNDNNVSEDRIRGWMDVPLSEEGIQDAKDVASYLKGMGISKIYSSDLSRAKETADIISKAIGAPVEYYSKDFRPWNLGDLQGKSSKEAQPEMEKYAEWTPDKKVTGGESFNDFKSRFLGSIEKIMADLEKNPDKIAIVSHFRNLKLAEAWEEEKKEMNGENKDSNYPIDYATFFENNMPVGSCLKFEYNGEWEMEKCSKEGEKEEYNEENNEQMAQRLMK